MAQILVLLKYTVTWRMEVAMSILKHQKLITLFGLSLLMSLSSPAQAQWPTLDLTAIKEGISSKIELVKQSKIVTEATKLGGKMNSAIGDAKSSVTKFAGDNLEKAKKKAEKLQKEKERLEEKKKKLEEKKEKLEKQKKKIEKAKKAMEEAKKLKEDAEKKIQEGKDMVNDVKSQVDEAKQMAADAQAAVNDAKATAQGAIADAKSTVGEVKSTVNDAKSTVGDAVGTVREEKNELQSAIGGQSGSAAADSSFVDDYVAQYEAGINSDAKIYEQMPAADSEVVSETLPAAGDVAAEPADEAETALAPAARRHVGCGCPGRYVGAAACCRGCRRSSDGHRRKTTQSPSVRPQRYDSRNCRCPIVGRFNRNRYPSDSSGCGFLSSSRSSRNSDNIGSNAVSRCFNRSCRG